jgi:predicted phosphodiesterase
LGNHDDLSTGKKLYHDYFYPDAIPTRTGTKSFYRIDVNGVHFLVLDLEWGTETYTLEQREWFEEQLGNIPKEDWTIVMCHAIFFSSGTRHKDNEIMIGEFEDQFIQNDVDLVISGHNHILQFLQKEGITYAIVGGLASHKDPSINENEYSLWTNRESYGYCEIDINSDNAVVSFFNENHKTLFSANVIR